MSDTFVEVIQEVRNNLQGTVIGVHAEHVQGNLIEVKLFSLDGRGSDDFSAIWNKVLSQATPPPYKYLEPYTATDEKIFFGRAEKIAKVLRDIINQPMLVIYGRAGVGKTSLVEAGVIPALIRKGALVVQLLDYTDPAEAVSKALKATARRTGGRPANGAGAGETAPGGGPEPEAGRPLFIILDQFELFFEASVSDEQREAFVGALSELLKTPPPNSIKVIILARDDSEVKGKMADLQRHLPRLLDCSMVLPLLPTDCAEEAMNEPLKLLDDKVSFSGEKVIKTVAADLDQLTEDEPGVYPPHLQIVCHELRERAFEKRPRVIDLDLYLSLKGAEAILAGYMQGKLETQLGNVRESALQLLSQMAAPGAEYWMEPSKLHLRGVAPAEMERNVSETLELLIAEQLLVRQRIKGKTHYGFVDQVTAQCVRRLSGDEMALRYQAADEMQRVWAAWLARNVLASRDQLRYLSEFGTHLELPPLRALFLLRSAVERDEPTRLWLDQLRKKEGRALIQELEDGTLPEGVGTAGLTVLKLAEFLLTQPPKPDDSGKPSSPQGVQAAAPAANGDGFKSVSGNAATYPKAEARLTSALALIALDEPERPAAVKALEGAMREKLGGLKLAKRRAELRGVLLEADLGDEGLKAGLSPFARAAVWCWTAWRRLARNRERLGKLPLYGAAGAALAIGLLRATLTLLGGNYRIDTSFVVQFHAYVYYFAVCAYPLMLGLLLGESLTTPRPFKGAASFAPGTTPRRRARAAALAVVLGGLLYGAAALLSKLAGFVGSGRPWLQVLSNSVPDFITGPAVGLGLASGLYTQLRAGWRMSAGRWLLSLGAGDSFLILSQLFFNLYMDATQCCYLIWDSSMYRDVGWGSATPERAGVFALADAAAFGLAATAGATLGLEAANRSIAKRLSSPYRIGD